MAVRIRFDNTHNVIAPTFVLGTRSGNKLGVIPACNINMSDTFGSKFELQFEVNKFNNGEKYALWDKLVNFAIIWCKEWDVWFEAAVEINDDGAMSKQVSCTSIGEAELSQVNLYGVEINTENDITRDDYVPTHLYDANNRNASLLHRILSKVPHYSIGHVDSRIAIIQRTFSFDNKSIYDSLQEIAEEIDCLFVINSNTNSNGKIQRSISAYDLESYCNACHKRGNFDSVCSECGSSDIVHGYGTDTAILISSDNLADEITLTTDTGSVKNCFRLECGDDLMTATVRNCNANGSQYIWCISDASKSDMSDDLKSKIEDYDSLYNYYTNTYAMNLSSGNVTAYNTLINKYDSQHNTHSELSASFTGYANLMNWYYDTINFRLYLESEMMPSVETETATAETELAKLTQVNIPYATVQNLSTCSLSTSTNAVLAVAKTIIDSDFKIEATNTAYDSTTHKWQGKFTVTNYSDETQIATSTSAVEVIVTDDREKYVKQRIDDTLKKESDSKKINSIEELFDLENVTLADFKTEIEKYCLASLNSFHDSCEACVNLLIEQGVSDKESWGADLYDDIYDPFYKRLIAIQDEIKTRETEIAIVSAIQSEIEGIRDTIQSTLNFENYLGEELWLEFVAYRREDLYKNDNYISDGLSDSELFQSARDFLDVARKEIYASANLQHSLSASLKNLLVMKEFETLTDKFSVGNWIRVKIDGTVYKLRLVSYTIDFDSLDKISVQFSDVRKYADGITDASYILSRAASMSSSYKTVMRQASAGESSGETIDSWMTSGMSLGDTKIVNSDIQNMVYDKHGLLFREYDPITETYGNMQLKIINKGMYLSDDNWETSKAAIGLCSYTYTTPSGEIETRYSYGINGEVIVGKLLLGESLGLHNESGSVEFDNDGLRISSSTITNNGETTSRVTISPNNELIFKIENGQSIVLSFDKSTGVLSVDGNINARTLTLDDSVTINASFIRGLSSVATSGNYNDLSGAPAPIDISGKFDNPTNNNSATNGQILTKQSNGSVWKTASNTIADNSTDLVTSQAVFNYALNKNQGTNNAGSCLYVAPNGEITPLTISELKTMLEI